MAWIVIGRAEIETTELAVAAFEGRVSALAKALKDGVDWAEEGSRALEGALYGGHLELAKQMLAAGSPCREGTYYIAFDYCPDALNLLPSQPELLQKIEASRRWPAFVLALLREDVAEAKRLAAGGVPINEYLEISRNLGNLAPVHYVALTANPELIELLRDLGADFDLLTEDGKSPLRLVAENRTLTNRHRRFASRCLVSCGARMRPDTHFLRKILLRHLGWRLP